MTKTDTFAPPTDDLYRRAAFTVTRTSDDGDGLTLEGYAAVFNEPTVIDSWEGRFEEIISPGAFKRTIDRKGPRGIRLQFDHGGHPLLGSLPMGVIEELKEDARGLFVRARLHDNWLIHPFRDAINDGSVNGMSFRFRVVKEEIDDSDDAMPVRTLREIELFEVGPVVWPAYDQTSVGVRAKEIAQALMDPEQRKAVAAALLSDTSERGDGPSDEPAGEPSSEPAESREEPVEEPSDPASSASDSHETEPAAVERAVRPARDFAGELAELLGGRQGDD